MKLQQIASRDNQVLKTIRLVASGARRAPRGLVVAEGVRILEEVEKAGSRIDAVVISDGFGSNPREAALLQRWESPHRNLRLYRTSAGLFHTVSEVRTPQGAVALVSVPETALDDISPKPDVLLVYACGIQDPGNLGTLIRSAAAAGAEALCTSPGTVSARNPKAIRSSAGCFFRIPVAEQVGLSEFRLFCEGRSIQPYRTDAGAGVTYTEADLKSSCAILLGNEGSGMDEEKYADIPAIRIPMAHGIESLNVAIAGAVILFEAFRQRNL